MKHRTSLQLFTIFAILSLPLASTNKVCKNFKGNPVDWYVIFLFPSVSSYKKLHYAYFDNTYTSHYFTYHRYSKSTFPPNHVTEYVISSKNDDFNYFFWNDDKTCKDDTKERSCSSSQAHSKGSLIHDSTSGVFLLHSLPRYPTCTASGTISNELPSNAGSNGQSFLCISVESSTSYKLAELLNYININNNFNVAYDRVNKQANEWISRLINNRYSSEYPESGIYSISSKGGMKFNVFMKSYRNKVIPYETTIRKYYNMSFYLRTWIRPNLVPSNCEEFKLENVVIVKFGKYKEYENTKEHAKWAVAQKGNTCCFGDINHTESQQNRGGNIFCFDNKNLAIAMRNIILKADEC